MKKPTLPEKAKQLLRRAKQNEKGCFITDIKPNPKGYIYVTLGRGVRLRAHRVVYEYLKGEIPPGLLVRHKCDNRACINPDHLLLGTAQDNSDDMVARNRQSRLGKPPTKDRLLMEALELFEEGYSYNEIARKQGLAGGTSAADRVRRAREL